LLTVKTHLAAEGVGHAQPGQFRRRVRHGFKRAGLHPIHAAEVVRAAGEPVRGDHRQRVADEERLAQDIGRFAAGVGQQTPRSQPRDEVRAAGQPQRVRAAGAGGDDHLAVGRRVAREAFIEILQRARGRGGSRRGYAGQRPAPTPEHPAGVEAVQRREHHRISHHLCPAEAGNESGRRVIRIGPADLDEGAGQRRWGGV
jgi:hypothetical protein